MHFWGSPTLIWLRDLVGLLSLGGASVRGLSNIFDSTISNWNVDNALREFFLDTEPLLILILILWNFVFCG